MAFWGIGCLESLHLTPFETLELNSGGYVSLRFRLYSMGFRISLVNYHFLLYGTFLAINVKAINTLFLAIISI